MYKKLVSINLFAIKKKLGVNNINRTHQNKNN